MMATDEDALYCDLAETYHLFDWDISLEVLARLAAGLRENSRIRMKMEGINIPVNTMLLAATADATRLLTWFNSESGHKNENRPPSFVEALTGAKPTGAVETFDSPEEFEARRKKILERLKNGD